MPQIETKRLIQRPWTLGALDALAAGRERLAALWGVRVPESFPQAGYAGILPMIRGRIASDPDAAQWGGVLVHRADRVVIGAAGFEAPPPSPGVVEIGYDVVAAYRGRGYATEIVRAMVDWALARADVDAVAARCDPANVGSVRVLEKAGFHRTGMADGLIAWRMP